MDYIKDMKDNEVKTTIRWSASIIIFLVIQTAGAIWWASNTNAQVLQNTRDINDLQNTNAVYLDRNQLNDILGARDQRIENIEKAVNRIEQKLDRINP